MDNLTYTWRRFVDFWTRARSQGYALIFLGVGLLAALAAGISFDVAIPTPGGPGKLSFDTGASVAAGVTYLAAAVAGLLILVGVWRCFEEWKAADRKRVFAIELRGLRDWSGPPLTESTPVRLIGRRELVAIDMRQKVKDGLIVDADVAVARVALLRQELASRESGVDRRDISYILGGLAPVPLTFLAGVLVDDETPITIMDWDRQNKLWRELDEADDGFRFQVTGLDTLAAGAPAVVLTISASYGVNIVGAQAKHPDIPLVHLALDQASTTSHWSETKQQALAQQFLDVALALERRGVREIHLFFAGPSSLVLRFGMTYDKRNLPSLIVYQYEQNQTPPFPWGVRMPVAGIEFATVVR